MSFKKMNLQLSSRPNHREVRLGSIKYTHFSYIPIYTRRENFQMKKFPAIIFYEASIGSLFVKAFINDEIHHFKIKQKLENGEILLRFSEYNNPAYPFLFIHMYGQKTVHVFNLCVGEDETLDRITTLHLDSEVGLLNDFQVREDLLSLQFENSTLQYQIDLTKDFELIKKKRPSKFGAVESNKLNITTNNFYSYHNSQFIGPLDFDYPGVKSYSVGENFIVALMQLKDNIFHIFKVEFLKDSIGKIEWNRISKYYDIYQSGDKLPLDNWAIKNTPMLDDYSYHDPDDLQKMLEGLNAGRNTEL